MGVQSLSTRLLARQSDERLLELLVEGHERAFEAIVLRYRGELLRYCERLGLSEARAEDALQHSLLKAWLALQGGTEVRELRAWLYRIVHNTAVNVMRSPSEERALDLDAALIEAVAAPESSLESATAAREALAHVAALPQMQRHVMLLSALEGRTHQEVASALGITDVAVRGLLYRARVTLRAAAATFTPAPLIGWFTQATSRLGARSGVAELTFGSGAPEAGGVLLKGAALAATAALAAGAVLGPLRGQHSSAGRTHTVRGAATLTSSPNGLVGAAASSPVSAALRTAVITPTGGKPVAGLHGVSPHSIRVPRNSTAPLVRRSVSVPHAVTVVPDAGPTPAPAAAPVTPVAGVPVKAVAAEGAPARGVSSEAPTPAPSPPGGETGGPVGAGAPEEAPKGEGPHSEHEEELAQEKAENEREAAKERTEREAETAREKTEREAEAARTQHEREPDS